ncbi:MAG: hypothetical protein GVY24_07700 [Planctomycetes bacterium]|jgi:hypothetical protein|nr:hypothetical protein [Planctomycetota bacterium]
MRSPSGISPIGPPLHVEPPAAEHVVGPTDLDAVEPNRRQRVQPVAAQLDVIVIKQLGRHIQFPFIRPVAVIDPVDVLLAVGIPRVVDHARGQQVGMHTPRHHRGEAAVHIVGLE